MKQLTAADAMKEANKAQESTGLVYFAARLTASGDYVIVGLHHLHVYLNDIDVLPQINGKYSRKQIADARKGTANT